jgi:hypothetical protein
MSRLGGLQVIDVINVAQRLLVHLDRVDNCLGKHLLLLLRLRLNVQALSLGEI